MLLLLYCDDSNLKLLNYCYPNSPLCDIFSFIVGYSWHILRNLNCVVSKLGAMSDLTHLCTQALHSRCNINAALFVVLSQ